MQTQRAGSVLLTGVPAWPRLEHLSGNGLGRRSSAGECPATRSRKRAQKSINPVAASDVGVRSAMGPPASRVGTMTSVLVPLHGIASRQDLPLPFTFVVVGAVLALIISFVVLVFAWRTLVSPP